MFLICKLPPNICKLGQICGRLREWPCFPMIPTCKPWKSVQSFKSDVISPTSAWFGGNSLQITTNQYFALPSCFDVQLCHLMKTMLGSSIECIYFWFSKMSIKPDMLSFHPLGNRSCYQICHDRVWIPFSICSKTQSHSHGFQINYDKWDERKLINAYRYAEVLLSNISNGHDSW
jgi:hypothetical protein